MEQDFLMFLTVVELLRAGLKHKLIDESNYIHWSISFCFTCRLHYL